MFWANTPVRLRDSRTTRTALPLAHRIPGHWQKVRVVLGLKGRALVKSALDLNDRRAEASCGRRGFEGAVVVAAVAEVQRESKRRA